MKIKKLKRRTFGIYFYIIYLFIKNLQSTQ